jgi:hypothetical protein
MKKYLAAAIIVLALVSCATAPDEARYARSAFSFSQCPLPALIDINENKYRVPVAKGVYRLTNVHPSFEQSFVFLQDEPRRVCVIKDKNGRTVFEGYLDGIPRYVACVDIDADGAPDVIVELAAYGNHGNGTESFEVLLNSRGCLTRQENPIEIQFVAGQENKAGLLTWYSAPGFCAVFEGEEADVRSDPLQVANITTVREVWGHKGGRICLLSKSATPTKLEAVRYLTFR